MTIQERVEALLKIIPSHVTLIAISKYATILQMQEAYKAGIRHFGESRCQQALAKRAFLPDDIIWHFIGPIQSNKASLIGTSFSFVHSISSYRVAKIISEACVKQEKICKSFIQLNLSLEETKDGFLKEEFLKLEPSLKSLPGLLIQGLMTIGPNTQDSERIRSCFHELSLLKKQFSYESLSMGMSQDYPLAIKEGSTHVRIGSGIFG